MADDYNISYSYSVGRTRPQPKKTAPAAPPEDQTLFAFGDCTEVNLPTNAVLLVNGSTGRQGVVTRDVAIALGHCREFRTLHAHAQYLTEYMPELGGDIDGVRTALESVRDNGLLIPAQHYIEQLTRPDSESSPVAPSRVFVITCDRPAAVQRILESVLANADLSRHESIYLIDDSRDKTNASANRACVERFNLGSPKEMVYFGNDEREALIDALIAAMPAAEASIRFLIDRAQWPGQKTFGLSRTLCLLLSVDHRAVIMDDDVLCQSIDSPYRKDGVLFFDGMCEADFFPSVDGWSKRYPPRQEDPLKGHLSCLGLDAGQALRKVADTELAQSALARSQQAVLKRLGPKSRVLVTQNGTFGDPGTEDSAWVFGLTGESLQRLLEPAAALEMKLKNRHYWMGWSQPTLAGQANMSQVTGLDNSATLPPYFPVWRGEDQIFGAMVDYLFPDSFVLNYPWAVPHLPLDERSGHINVYPDTAGIGLVENYITSQRPSDNGLSFDNRLQRLVALLEGVGDKSDADLASTYRETLAVDQATAVRQLTDQLRRAPAEHSAWKALLEDRRKRYFAAVGRTEVPVLVGGASAETSESEIWEKVRAYSTQFAQCLRDWPAIREAASQALPKRQSL